MSHKPNTSAYPLILWSRLQAFELGLAGIGLCTGLILAWHAGWTHPTTSETWFVTGCFILVLQFCCRRWRRVHWQRVRMAAHYGFALWFFGAIARIIPAWGRQPLDAALLGIDVALFGQTPAAILPHSPTATILLSGAYLSYLFYLHIALLHYGFGPIHKAQRAWQYVFGAYCVGFAGYLCIPAKGPYNGFPTLFSEPLPGMTHWLSQLNHGIVSQGSGVYDVFPSLHVLITCVLMHIDWHMCRRRFWTVLPLSLPLFASTLYLRYHYAIDLLVGFCIFAILATWFHQRTKPVTT